jgi:ribosomal-protein-alanine N-acetyltransferase
MSKELFHRLEGDKICFRELDTKDTEAVHSYASDEDVSRFIGWPLMKTIEETRTHIEEMLKRESAGTHLYASVVLKKTQEVIGTVMIFNFDRQANHAEVGYVFHKDHWGKGYGTEAVALMSDFALKVLKLHKLHARVVDVNVGSARVLERNGFQLEGRLRDFHHIEGSYCDSLLYGKL